MTYGFEDTMIGVVMIYQHHVRVFSLERAAKGYRH